MPGRSEHVPPRKEIEGKKRGVAAPRGHEGIVNTAWSIRRFREGALEGPVSVEFTFPTEGGGSGRLCIPYSELRHPGKLLDQFANYLPEFPPSVGAANDSRHIAFLRELVASHEGPLEWVPHRTGFHDLDAFVTHAEIIRGDGTRVGRPAGRDAQAPLEPRGYVDLRGTVQGERNGVLKLARYSSYLAFEIGVALASPLPTYVRLRRQAKGKIEALVPETAVFNLSGKSSSGKSSACLAAMSLAGSPDRVGSLDFTRRGLAEMANDHNDLPFATDDTEKAEDGPGGLIRSLKALVHMLPGGRSKTISRGVDPVRFPELRWTTFGLCTSPRPVFVLAAESHWTLSPGDEVRLFNIKVPGPKAGGIFDRIPGTRKTRAKRSLRLIGDLQRGYLNHHGHTFPLWILFLMANDRSKRMIRLADKFIDHVGARTDGWEVRFAQKFGVIYAAMELGLNSGLLPWPKSLPLKVATKCYRNARESAKVNRPDSSPTIVARLDRLFDKPGRVVAAPSAGKKPTEVTHRTVAIRYVKDGRTKFGVLDDALIKLLGSKTGKAAFTADILKAGLVKNGHGHAGTTQERIPIKRNGRIIDRPRLWVIDATDLKYFLQH
jgi:hypothetical protein